MTILHLQTEKKDIIFIRKRYAKQHEQKPPICQFDRFIGVLSF